MRPTVFDDFLIIESRLVKLTDFKMLLQELGQFLLDLLWPPRCVACQASGNWLCANCREEITLIGGPVCDRCGMPVRNASTPCRQCQKHPLQFIDGIRSAAFFKDNPIRSAIHFLKYRNHKVAATELAQLLVDAYKKYNLAAEVIVPVPLHVTRQRDRGYNQSELLAVALGKKLGLPVNAATLYRTRQTKSQMKLSAAERRDNVKDAFACTDTRLSGQTVLLIDDVCTTGATLEACAKALKQCGAAHVWGLTLARAD